MLWLHTANLSTTTNLPQCFLPFRCYGNGTTDKEQHYAIGFGIIDSLCRQWIIPIDGVQCMMKFEQCCDYDSVTHSSRLMTHTHSLEVTIFLSFFGLGNYEKSHAIDFWSSVFVFGREFSGSFGIRHESLVLTWNLIN